MNLTVAFPEFDKLRQKMGAKLSTSLYGTRELLQESCVDYEPELVCRHKMGVFLYQKEPVILYIGENPTGSVHNWPYKYHLFECGTIANMTTKGLRQRYKVSSRTDGKFFVSTNRNVNQLVELTVCSNCLKKIPHYIGKRSGMTLEQFDIKKYFDVVRIILDKNEQNHT